MRSPTGQLYCDFCGKGEEDCTHIITTVNGCRDAAICQTCVLECVDRIFRCDGSVPEHFPLRPAAPDTE